MMAAKMLGNISAHPVKSFFVHMLTRDILLQDAILDLLDNCVDGVQRSAPKQTLAKRDPYKGYWAKIHFSPDRFSIEDNCGGIPWDLHDYAFRMGRVKKNIVTGRPTIGTYGIGMKRAIFKIGRDCRITTHAKDASYRLRLTPDWMEKDDVWEIPAAEIPRDDVLGTTVRIEQIRQSVKSEFDSAGFEDKFRETVAEHYAYIIGKGFQVYVNGIKTEPKSIRLLFADDEEAKAKHPIRPYIYKARHDGVEVFLAVGFTRPIPSSDDVEESVENYRERYSSGDAGWTIICNDRTVLYCDKSSLTGWGISGVPQYHMQFISISGIVVFTADDAQSLPMTTTKRGIDMSSDLYLHVRDKMIEGMKIFTQYTNQWKSKELASESRARFKETSMASLAEIRNRAAHLSMSSTRGAVAGMQYRPVLPRPEKKKTHDRISFSRSVENVRQVSTHLFGTPNTDPSEVGGKCFDLILEEAVR